MIPHQELLAKTYAAFNRRDIDAVLDTMHAEVDWPNGWEGGRLHGRAAVRGYWERQWAAINPQVEPVSFVGDQTGRTVVEVHQVIRDGSGNIVADRIVQHVYAFRDGLVVRMDIVEPQEMKI